ncbi:MAG TPA: type IV toxin-antitoxin system AbiEi family antitoxin domain-containing protein, partial [Solirubrobacterales bacterium]|nr:type IV toxin-antitoxin system AbiEi family antitoxin domain-containing protein [Solirubrobacterales bacterium]
IPVGDKGRTPTKHRPLFEVATRQHGVVSARQLASLGYSRNSAAKAAGVARLHRLHQGVYAVGHRRLTWYSHCWAGVLGAEPNETDEVVWPAVASHGSAAYLWGLYRFAPDTIDLTAPIRRRAKRRFRVHFSSILAAEDREERREIPVTSVSRTLLDLAIRARPDQLERLLERAEELDLLDIAAIEALLDRAGGHRGRGRLGRALAVYRPDPTFTRSRFERSFRRRVTAAGIPVPAMNLNVEGYELDAYWPDLRFAVELDLFETHGTRAAFERDRLRHEELKLLGIEMVRVTRPRFLQEPDAVLANLAALLDRRRRELNGLD